MGDRITFGEITGFLSRAGGMGVLLTIDKKNGTTHTELERKVHVSRATVTKRLAEAENIDLVKIDRRSDDHANAKRYVLTQMGRVMRVAMESMGLHETYRQYMNLEEELDQSTEEMIDWMNETGEVWDEKIFHSEFEFKDILKQEDTYPGEDVPNNFESYIKEATSIVEAAERATNHYESDASDVNEPDQTEDTTEDDSTE